MTMLDRMRRHRDWLKWSLGLVCVAFVLFYIPDFLRGSGADAASSDTIAKVEGREITSAAPTKLSCRHIARPTAAT
jgi:hypothetical protein